MLVRDLYVKAWIGGRQLSMTVFLVLAAFCRSTLNLSTELEHHKHYLKVVKREHDEEDSHIAMRPMYSFSVYFTRNHHRQL